MKKLTSLKELALLDNNNLQYKGVLEKYQLHGRDENGVRYQHYKLTDYQMHLYTRAIRGLSVYSKSEIKGMHWERKQRILKVARKGKSSLNALKQERVNELCKGLYHKFFSQSEPVKVLFYEEEIGIDSDFICTLDHEKLGITKRHIIAKFMMDGVLPKNFFELKEPV